MKKLTIGEKAPFPWFETHKTLKQIREEVNNNFWKEFSFSTNSLFVMRQFTLRYGEDNVVFENTDTSLTGTINDIGNIEALEEDLNQSSEYMDACMFKK